MLASEQRRQLPDQIWQLYLNPIHRYAELVQQLPASETHHHAYLGGMLDHGLELVVCSLKLRQSYLLPTAPRLKTKPPKPTPGPLASPMAALLHDIGKVAGVVENRD